MNHKKSAKEREKIRWIILALALSFITPFTFALSGTGGTISVDAQITGIVYNSDTSQIISQGALGNNILGSYLGNQITGSFGLEQTSQNDTSPPIMILRYPANNSGIIGSTVTFSYELYDQSSISRCDLYIDQIHSGIDNSPVNGQNGFIITNIAHTLHSWYLNCEDINGLQSNSSVDYFTIFAMSNFDNSSTNLTNVNLSAVPNLTLEKSGNGKIVFSGTTNISAGIDFDKYIIISGTTIFVNSSAVPILNKPATLTLFNFPYKNTVIWKDGEVCQNCNVVSNNGGTLIFNVSGFSNYTVTSTSRLVTYDDTTIKTILPNQSVTFTANYTNITSGEAIFGNCDISFNLNGWTSPLIMTYNATSNVYLYNRSFDNSTHYTYVVNCTTSTQGFDNLSLTNILSISSVNGELANINITNLGSSRINFSYSSKNLSSNNGNVTELKFSVDSITNSWQGYYGNVSAKLGLIDATGNSLYDWENITVTGELLASRSPNIDWTTVDCANANGMDSENNFLGKPSSASDSVTNTFKLQDHPPFFVGVKPISNCYSTKLHGASGANDENFWNVILSDNNGEGSTLYTNILKDNSQGFTSKTIDFELLVAAKNNEVTPYYFYLEIG